MLNDNENQKYGEEAFISLKTPGVYPFKSLKKSLYAIKKYITLQDRQMLKNRVLDYLGDILIVIDSDHRIVIWNLAATEMFNLSSKQTVKQDCMDLMHPIFPEFVNWLNVHLMDQDEKQDIELLQYNDEKLIAKYNKEVFDNQTYHLLLLSNCRELTSLQFLLKQKKSKLEKNLIDHTEELQGKVKEEIIKQQRLARLALIDSLTGLPNRHAFITELDNAVNRCVNDNIYMFTLIFIDLDGFKTINDILGHHAGDLLLVEISKRMRNFIRSSDVCARLGGDEFIILMHGIGSGKHMNKIADNLLSLISAPVDFPNKQQMSVSGSLGIYHHGREQRSQQDISFILSMADKAMYSAKERGKNCYVIFNKTMQLQMHENINLISVLDETLNNGCFSPYFQPIYDLQGNIKGVEALSRWKHKGKFIAPQKFIPLLEQRGLIKQFTIKLIQQIFNVLITHKGFPCVSINLSIHQFYDDEFIVFLDDLFKGNEALRSYMSFEVTESLFDTDPTLVMEKIDSIREKGFRVCIDNFGTGFSSFSYIRKFAVDIIKIDREFIGDIVERKKDINLLKGMIALIKSLEIEVILEGVETLKQLQKISSIHQNVNIQGFYFHHPMPLDELLEYLDNK